MILNHNYNTENLDPAYTRKIIRDCLNSDSITTCWIDLTHESVVIPDFFRNDLSFNVNLSDTNIRDLLLKRDALVFTSDFSDGTYDFQAFIPYGAIRKVSSRPQWLEKVKEYILTYTRKFFLGIYVMTAGFVVIIGLLNKWNIFGYEFFYATRTLWVSESTIILHKAFSVLIAMFEAIFCWLIAPFVFVHEYFGIDGIALELLVIVGGGFLVFLAASDDTQKSTANIMELNLELLGLRPIFRKTQFNIRRNFCLYCGPFSDEHTSIYKKVIRDPLAKINILVKRADEISSARQVMDEFWETMNQSAIIIAELTGMNPNVLYEIGMAHTIGKKVIIITQSAADLPFDLRHHRVVPYTNNEEGLKELEHRIVETVQNELGLGRQKGMSSRGHIQHKPEQDQETVTQSSTAKDLIGYQRLAENARRTNNPRQVIRDTLAKVAEEGLPEGHCIYLTFLTHYAGVVLHEQLRQRYQPEMTVVLQHQFWDLEASEEGLAVTLSFSDVRERLFVPYDAVTVFGDPKVDFVIDFRQ